MNAPQSAETKVEPTWVYLTIYPDTKSWRYKTLTEDWDKMTEDERQTELFDAAVELAKIGPFEYEETGRGEE